jgi:asparagine synthase (glutamine-hydrolysing)
MSGIAGLVRFDGRAVDAALLRRMTDSMATRGPDGRHIWVNGSAGFGHALLNSDGRPAGDRQPTSLDGQVWITADARIDGRRDLVRELGAHGARTTLEDATDAQLILHAYAAWGERAVDHLLGDFAFAIWDDRSRQLFCARDHFGVKPFYYAELTDGIVFSNSLDCVRLHPAVGSALNEIAVGDFLVFGLNRNPGTTTFANIRRLVAGHSLTSDAGGHHTRRYWTVPTGGRIRYRQQRDYVEHFRDLLRTAVADRLPAGRVDVWMSGGLDSTSITAVARELRSEFGNRAVHAHTVVYDTLIPNDERRYATDAAHALGVPISFFAADDYVPFAGWDAGDLCMPEPSGNPFLLLRLQQLRQVASHSRVLLCGEGADEALWRSDLLDLVGCMPWGELAADVARGLASYRVRPAIGLRDRLKKWRRLDARRFRYPTWLNREFVERIDLPQRVQQVTSGEANDVHPIRAEAHRRLTTGPWDFYFESSDPGATGVAVEIRYPFIDVRLVKYLLAIPPVPWFVAKTLLREAMKGVLPDSVRRRRKTPLEADPLRAHLSAAPVRGLPRPLRPVPDLERCIDHAAVPPLDGARGGRDPWLDVRPYCLNHWLARLHA